MRFKRLFTVSEGEKVTENALRRVLISSICSILICMTCLVSTTWAWFTVSVESKGNTIAIVSAPTITVQSGGATVLPDEEGGYTLDAGEYKISVVPAQDSNATTTDALGKSSAPVYVVMSIGDSERSYYIEFSQTREISLEVAGDTPAEISFSASWSKPASDSSTEVPENGIVIGARAEETTTNSLEDTTEDTTEDTPEDSTGDAVGDTPEDSTGDAVGDTVGDTPEDSTGDAVGDTTTNSSEDPPVDPLMETTDGE